MNNVIVLPYTKRVWEEPNIKEFARFNCSYLAPDDRLYSLSYIGVDLGMGDDSLYIYSNSTGIQDNTIERLYQARSYMRRTLRLVDKWLELYEKKTLHPEPKIVLAGKAFSKNIVAQHTGEPPKTEVFLG